MLDAKYKRDFGEESRTDRFQVCAYALAFDADRASLVYRFGNRHYWFRDYAGGWHVDWAVHHYDVVHWCMGVKYPVAATALGGHHAFEECQSRASAQFGWFR